MSACLGLWPSLSLAHELLLLSLRQLDYRKQKTSALHLSFSPIQRFLLELKQQEFHSFSFSAEGSYF